MKYEIHYSIYGCENVVRFKGFFQCTNWVYVMEKNCKEHFKIIEVIDLVGERRKQNETANL